MKALNQFWHLNPRLFTTYTRQIAEILKAIVAENLYKNWHFLLSNFHWEVLFIHNGCGLTVSGCVTMFGLAALSLALLQCGVEGFTIFPGNSLTHQKITESALLDSTMQVCRSLAQAEGKDFVFPVRVIFTELRSSYFNMLWHSVVKTICLILVPAFYSEVGHCFLWCIQIV